MNGFVNQEVLRVEAVKTVMRVISYLFHAVLGLFLLAIGVLALASGSRPIRLNMLPWTGTTLIYVAIAAGLIGLLTVLLAVKGSLRILFLIWNVAVAVMLVKGYIFSGYRFEGGKLGLAPYLILFSLLSLVGAWFAFRGNPVRKGWTRNYR